MIFVNANSGDYLKSTDCASLLEKLEQKPTLFLADRPFNIIRDPMTASLMDWDRMNQS